MAEFALILPAAGRSVRFGRNKLLEPLAGKPVILRTLEAFMSRGDLAQVVIATSDPEPIQAALGPLFKSPNADRIQFCAGGETRAHSVWSGAKHVQSDIEWVAVHDAARPMITTGLIDRTLAAAIEHGAAVPALPVALTIKQAAGPLPAKIERTVPRQSLWAMQTPQIMRRSDLLAAFEACPLPLDQVTDDVQLLELHGKPAWLVNGEERNLKITTAIDLKIAEMILREAGNPG